MIVLRSLFIALLASVTAELQHSETGRALPSTLSLVTFKFSKVSETVFDAKEATECDHGAGTNVPGDAIHGDVALLSTKYEGKCWTDGRYNSKNFKVEKGTLNGTDGKSWVAYKFYPPAVKAEKADTVDGKRFQGEKEVYLRNAKAGDVILYSFDGVGFKKVANTKVPGGIITVKPNVFAGTGIGAADLKAPMVFMFDADDTRLSTWPLLSSGCLAAWLPGCLEKVVGDGKTIPWSSQMVEGAVLASAKDFTLSARRFMVSGRARPFVPESDWQVSPNDAASNSGIPKKFFTVSRTDGKEGVVWRDEVNKNVYMTWFATDLLSSETQEIGHKEVGSYQLLGAASDGASSIVLVKLSETPPPAKTAGVTAYIIKVHSTTGKEIFRKPLATGKDDMNTWSHHSSGASIVWDTRNNRIGMVLARLYTKASDGLNRQGASAFIFDPQSLELVSTPYEQTSGHSFANSLILTSDNTFLGMDLGDNSPRGIHIWGFNSDGVKLGDRLVYAFKTQHSNTAKSSAGKTYEKHTDISAGDKTFYKWSNDNNVYTEIAHDGLVEVDDSILVFFAGERAPLDNLKVGAIMNEPRNMGFVRIGKNLKTDTVLSSGATATGGFYTFGGTWSKQENKGINFLTSYTSTDQCVSRPKTARMSKGRNILLWELWTKTAYSKSQVMVVDDTGSAIQEVFDLAYPLRLPATDNIVIRNGKAIVYAGTMQGHITRYEICTDQSCAITQASVRVFVPEGKTEKPTVTSTTATTTTVSGSAATTKGETATAPATTAQPSGAVSTTTTAKGLKGIKVTGTTKLTLSSVPENFKTDPRVKEALQEAIADTIQGMKKRYVKILDITSDRRLSDLRKDSRRLAAVISVKYEINLPPNWTGVKLASAKDMDPYGKLAANINSSFSTRGVGAEVTSVEITNHKSELAVVTPKGKTNKTVRSSSLSSVVVALVSAWLFPR